MCESQPLVPDRPSDPLGGALFIGEPDRQPPLSGWSLLCVYCRRPVPIESFTYWSSIHRLVGAQCPHCLRRTTVRATTWLGARSLATSDRPGR